MSEMDEQYKKVLDCVDLWVENSARYKASYEQELMISNCLQHMDEGLRTELETLRSQVGTDDPGYIHMQQQYEELLEKYDQLLVNVESTRPLLKTLSQDAENLQTSLLDELYQRLHTDFSAHDDELKGKYDDAKPQAPIPYQAKVEETLSTINKGFNFFDDIE